MLSVSLFFRDENDLDLGSIDVDMEVLPRVGETIIHNAGNNTGAWVVKHVNYFVTTEEQISGSYKYVVHYFVYLFRPEV